MPRLSVFALRAALINLLIGFTFGTLLLSNKGQAFSPQVWMLLPAHIELLLVGWMAQLAYGTAFWILPRFAGGSRGNENLMRGALFLLNFGVLLVSIQAISPMLFLTGRVFEILSGVFFGLHAWPRIKPLYPR